MSEPLPAKQVKMPKIRQGIPTIYGVVVMLVVLIGVIIMFIFLMPSQELAPTPLVSIDRSSKETKECVAGGTCAGPTITAEDPEGDQLTYKFYDQETGEQVGEVVAPSGEPVTPEFVFGDSGDKQIYMVVEDGAGHTSKNYPIIIPVK